MILDDILKNIPDKRSEKNTTSLKFKQDFIDFFRPLNLKRCVEIGTAYGHSTYMLSHLFEHVVTIDISLDNINRAREFTKGLNNIEFLLGDSGETDWDQTELFNVSFIDAHHHYPYVMKDVQRSLQYGTSDMYIVFDDYGLPENVPAVKVAVDELIGKGILSVVKYIGEPAGNDPKIGRPLVAWEGIICKRV